MYLILFLPMFYFLPNARPFFAQTLFTRFRETVRVCAKGVSAAPAKAAAAGDRKRQKKHGRRPQGVWSPELVIIVPRGLDPSQGCVTFVSVHLGSCFVWAAG